MFDGVAFLKDIGVKFTTRSKNVSSGWIGLTCPFCGDRSDHMGFNLRGGYFHCWKCGGHSVFDTVQMLTRSTKRDVFLFMRKYGSNVINKNYTKETKGVKYVEVPETPLSERERKYLENRGCDSYHLEETYQIKGGGITGKWKFRVVIPIFQNNQCVSLQGRSIAGQDPRYLFLPAEESVVPAKQCIYNVDTCKDRIVVVEGVFGVFKLGKGVGATLGAKLTNEQLAILSQFPSVTFLFDNDEAGRKAVDRYGTLLASLGVTVEDVVLPKSYSSPDEIPEDEVADVKRELLL